MTNKPDPAIAAERIKREFTTLGNLLRELVVVPERHSWRKSDDQLTWWAGDTIQSSAYGASYFINLTKADCSDPEQIHVEIRWLWKACENTPQKYQIQRDQMSATLWCIKGPRFYMQNRSLFADNRAEFVYADDIETLAREIAARLNAAMASETFAIAA